MVMVDPISNSPPQRHPSSRDAVTERSARVALRWAVAEMEAYNHVGARNISAYNDRIARGGCLLSRGDDAPLTRLSTSGVSS
jgi:DNA segregation ATPase FtsK/SpoIIIE-like protein